MDNIKNIARLSSTTMVLGGLLGLGIAYGAGATDADVIIKCMYLGGAGGLVSGIIGSISWLCIKRDHSQSENIQEVVLTKEPSPEYEKEENVPLSPIIEEDRSRSPAPSVSKSDNPCIHIHYEEPDKRPEKAIEKESEETPKKMASVSRAHI